MFTALANLATRRPKRVVVGAVVLFIAAAALGGDVAARLGPYGADDPATESVRANHLVERGGVEPGVNFVALGPKDARLDRLAARLRREPAVGKVVTWHEGGRALVSKDGRRAYVAVSFKSGTNDDDEAHALAQRYGSVPGVSLGGASLAEYQVNQQVSKDLRRAELLAFPLLFLLSLVFFRSLVASLLPLLVGGLAIVLTFLGLRIASEFGSISVFALNLVTGLGLGLAIDYSLFIVSRYREELAATGDSSEAVRRTLATAGRTVLFSSLTVTAALASLLVFPQKFLYSMGLGGMMVSLIAASVALVVLPAVLKLLGTRVNALAPKRLQRAAGRDAQAAQSGFWYRLSRAVMRRPLPIAVTSAAVLVVLGLPFLGIKFISIDASVLPHSASARKVDVALKTQFPPGRTSPVFVATRSSPAGTRAYARQLAHLPGVDSVSPPQPAGAGVTVLNVYPRSSLLSNTSQDLVRDIRGTRPPFTALAGGETAHFVDLKQSLVNHMPAALLIIVAATLVVLFVMTGSVILPFKALLMNVLTLSATFGLLVFVFQDGRLEGLLGYTSQNALEATQPIVLVALAFGLSTDYGVFLLSRIKEARDHGASNREAVAAGLERTGRIVTAAALLFCVAIGAFATSEIIFIKEVGIGTALAVLIDATIVRALLVPSLMEMLGRWNWWAPGPLRRLHDRFGWSEGAAVSGGGGRAASPAPTARTQEARTP
jgi:uncharacterized membrane protein YdfJ with MMPL/SSD domain